MVLLLWSSHNGMVHDGSIFGCRSWFNSLRPEQNACYSKNKIKLELQLTSFVCQLTIHRFVIQRLRLIHWGWVRRIWISDMKASSNGNCFRITGPLCREFMGFLTQRPVMWSFDVFFDLHLNKPLSKQSWRWWVEMPLRSLRHYCNGTKWLVIIGSGSSLLPVGHQAITCTNDNLLSIDP